MGNAQSEFIRNAPLVSQRDAPLVTFDDRFLTDGATLVLNEKLFSGSDDDFSIEDTTGHRWFAVKTPAFSFREKKTLFDEYGRPLLTIKQILPSLYEKQEVFKLPSQELVASTTNTNLFGRPKIAVSVRTSNGDEDIEIEGTHFERYFLVTRMGQPIAKTVRVEGRTSNHKYLLKIAAGVDVALMVALVTTLSEIPRD